MYGAQQNNDIYLNLQLRKAQNDSESEYGKTDENGNYIFEVEASNENLDFQNQIVLQNALLESKNNFLQHGVISYDHQHKVTDKDGKLVVDNSKIIGEPIDVKVDGKSTIVVGKLYKSNKFAQDFIKLLKDGSTRVRASVGGIFPDIIKNKATGVEKITHVLWNDLALTCTPVNNSVGNAVFVKSMNPDEFVKALAAGYETDSSIKTDGNALIPENTSIKTINVDKTNIDNATQNRIIRKLISCLESGEIKGEKQAGKFLKEKGIDEEQSRQIVREIIEQGGQIMSKSFSSRIKEMMKSFAGNQKDEDEDIKDEEEDSDDDDVLNLDDDSEEDENEEDGDVEKKTKKSKSTDDDDDDEEVADGTEILKSLAEQMTAFNKSLTAVQKQYDDLGNAVVNLAEMVSQIGNEKLPPRSVGIAKSLGVVPNTGDKKFTQEDYAFAQKALCKAVKDGEISMTKSCAWDSEIQKAMTLNAPLSNEVFSFLKKKWDSK